jgi:hypothetical protein
MAKKSAKAGNGHVWRFFRAGGFDQVRLDSSEDLLALEKLDQKLWVALACPVHNVHFDARTLSLIDADGDGRIRAAELIAATKWTAGMVKNPGDLIEGSNAIAVNTINDSTEQGSTLAAATRNALKALGREESGSISVEDAQALGKVLSEKPFNGDGVITEDAAQDDGLKGAIRDIMSAMGSVDDRSGKPGINSEKVENFFKLARDYAAWVREGEQNPAIRPLGASTADAAQAIFALKDKIGDYFTRCAVAAFDERSIPLLNGGEKEFSACGASLLSAQCADLAKLPLARIEARRPLPLTKDINPAWTDAMDRFEKSAVRPQLGTRESLAENDWSVIMSAFAPWFAWQERKPAPSIEALGMKRILDLLAKEKSIIALIEQDKAEALTYASLVDLEKLVRFRRDLYKLCTNFVNFKDFYAKGGPAIFQAGTLYLDQRSCNLCLKVDDANKHASMAAMAGTYLVYCECRRKTGIEKMTIVAAFTNGDSDNLIVGRNGVFYDRSGGDWDATIIKIIENPISIRQAFWLPYKGLVRMIESQVAKRATAAEAQSSAKLSQVAAVTANADKHKPEPLPPPPKKLDVGIVAALGVAAGALGTFIATFFGYAAGIVRLGPVAILGAIIGLLLLISGPSIILAYIKLRKRNLGPILDAGGWAINAKACINVPFGAVLTHVAVLPPGA